MLDTRDTCNYVAERLGAEPVQAIGNKFIIYRKSDEEKYRKIELPRK
jgi:RNA-binding protein